MINRNIIVQIKANHINILNRQINYSDIHFKDGIIESITILQNGEKSSEPYILPGFVDAHVHIESSLLSPGQFARLAVVHGTIGTVSDPHEIANVLGMNGIRYMLDNANNVPFKFCFGAPSCVPATIFETAGAKIGPNDLQHLFDKYPEIGYLAEVMNYPGVLNADAEILEKIAIAKAYGKPIDGHAPGLKGLLASQYAAAGPSTDHECYTVEEAIDKLAAGMKILIREGSAAKNFDELIPLLPMYYQKIMFCSDDKHPDELVIGHINLLVKRALKKGYNLFEILQAACINPVKHYKLSIGLIEIGDTADFILVDNLVNFGILATYINGNMVAKNQLSLIENIGSTKPNNFNCSIKKIKDFHLKYNSDKEIKIMEVIDGQLITKHSIEKMVCSNGLLLADPTRDILKIAVINRYENKPISIGFIKNFGIKNGAMGSSVAHDSHNIIVVGTSDNLLCQAANMIISEKGGLSAVHENGGNMCLPLPIGGIMSHMDGYWVAQKYAEIDAFSKNILKSTLKSPYMSLSFMALLVIPNLKLSDKGLFDGDKFEFTNLFEN